jgi:cytochrome c oxidase assembly protein subunit 15
MEIRPTAAERFTISAVQYRRIVVVALALLCIIVLTGAAVRLTGSGLGCSDWPNCETDKLISVSDSHQAIEQLNRLFTGAVSVGVIAAVLGAMRRRPYDRTLVSLALGLVAGVVAQIVLGGISVLSGLNPIVVAGHFGLSMVLVVNATVLLHRSGDRGPRGSESDAAQVRWLSWLTCAAGAMVLVVTGPMLTGSGPHAGDQEAERISIAIPDAARIHSLSAWLFLALIVGLVLTLWQRGANATIRSAYPLLVVVLIQGAIGYTQYELGIPPWLVILHIAGATAITIATTWFQLNLLRNTDDRVGRPHSPVDTDAPPATDGGHTTDIAAAAS